jgi:hypothetical protein
VLVTICLLTTFYCQVPRVKIIRNSLHVNNTALCDETQCSLAPLTITAVRATNLTYYRSQGEKRTTAGSVVRAVQSHCVTQPERNLDGI